MKDKKQFDRAIDMANAAKERLAEAAEMLEEAGYTRKAKSCMNLVYAIEEWQRRGA